MQVLSPDEIEILISKAKMDIKWLNQAKEVETIFFECDVNLAESIVEIAKNYLLNIFMWKTTPTSKESRGALHELISSISDVVNKLNNTHHIISSRSNIIGRTLTDNQTSRNNHWNFQRYINDSELTIRIFQELHDKIPIKKGGPNPKPILKELLISLVEFYRKSGGIINDHGHDRKEDVYEGKIYEFTIMVKPLLEELGIKFNKDNTIGRDLNDIINP